MFLGSDDAAAACLAALHDAGLVGLVVTPPALRRGRRGRPEPTECGAVAAAAGIRVLPTSDVNADDALAVLREASPRLLVVVSFGQFLRRPVREAAPLGAVNLHYSLLPRWRGAAPVQRAILAGDAVTGATVQRVRARLDSGPVLAAAEVPIRPEDDTPSLRRALTGVGAPLLVGVVRRLLGGEVLPGSEQDEGAVTHAPQVAREEGLLDFARDTAAVAARKVRAFEPWPRCKATLLRAAAEPMEVVLRAAAPLGAAGTRAAAPGDVVAAGPDGLDVATCDGVLRISRLQRTGGREVDARAFLNGFPAAPGDRFVPSR